MAELRFSIFTANIKYINFTGDEMRSFIRRHLDIGGTR
jgi:hypothetical protein